MIHNSPLTGGISVVKPQQSLFPAEGRFSMANNY